MYFPVSCVHTHACICFKHIYIYTCAKIVENVNYQQCYLSFLLCNLLYILKQFFSSQSIRCSYNYLKKKSKVKTAGSFLKKVILVEISWSPRTGGGDVENVLFKGTRYKQQMNKFWKPGAQQRDHSQQYCITNFKIAKRLSLTYSHYQKEIINICAIVSQQYCHFYMAIYESNQYIIQLKLILYVNYISIKKEKYVLNNFFKKLVLTYLDIESMTI